jgi:hypothetical protein
MNVRLPSSGQLIEDVLMSGNGDFAIGSGTIRFTRIGNQVNASMLPGNSLLKTIGAPQWNSTNICVPSWAIPPRSRVNVCQMASSHVTRCTINDDGSLSMTFRNWSGGNYNETTDGSFNISYNV